MYESFLIEPGKLTFAELKKFAASKIKIELEHQADEKISAAREFVEKLVREGNTIYGVNTGFGKLAQQRISNDDLLTLQKNLILSHSAGVGAPLSRDIVRLAMLLKVNSLAQGYSGVRRELIDRILEMINADAIPVVPSQGSVGASGDLSPLAHMSAPIIGEGQVCVGGQIGAALSQLESVGIQPLELAPKEGIALINGTQISTAIAIHCLIRLDRVFQVALMSGAMSVDAALGSDAPFDAKIHQIRGQHGQIECAAGYRALLSGSEIRESHRNCSRVQDPYSLRCQPQVMGACLDQLRFAAKTLLVEANAVTDNPLVFLDHASVLSGGNFHAEPVALACDQMAVAIAEIGSLAERRIALLNDSNFSDLPPFLTRNGGLNSGYMIAHVTAAALTSENKMLSHPASVDSIPTSANQEDHVSMATHGAYRLQKMIDNLQFIIAIELLCASEGIQFREPLVTSLPLQSVISKVRQVAERYETDRAFDRELSLIANQIENGEIATGSLVEIASICC